MDTSPAPPVGRRWSWWRFIGYSAVVAVVYVAAQAMAIVGVALAKAAADPAIDALSWAMDAGFNGFALSVTTLVAAAVAVPLVRSLTARIEVRPWEFLGFRRVPARHIVLGCLTTAAFIAVSDLVSVSMGRPLVSPFLVEAYATAGFLPLLFVALVVAGPFCEEVVFRGFFYSGLRSCGATVAAALLVSSAVFAVIHAQYDAHDMAVVFLLGLLFCMARVRFDSIIPSIAMHGLANAVGFVEVALAQRGVL